jgi:hypothetical protein
LDNFVESSLKTADNLLRINDCNVYRVMEQLSSVKTYDIDVSLFSFTDVSPYATALFSSYVFSLQLHCTHCITTHEYLLTLRLK